MQVKIGKENIKVKPFKGLSIFKGLIFNSSDNALLIFKKEGKVSIHTFFCPSLFLIFLDKSKTIVDFKLLKPFKVYSCKKKVKYVIELQMRDYKKVKKFIKNGLKIHF